MSTGKPQDERRAEEWPLPKYVDGVILFDAALRVLSFDDGAAIILNKPLTEPAAERVLQIPQEILAFLKEGRSSDPLSRRTRIQLASGVYTCRIHIARARAIGVPGYVTVVHLARELSMDDALTLISAEYRLTVREQQAVRGVLSGLSSKEVAMQMSISPNTVKAFLRLVMSKMGVSSRTGIIAKLFEPNAHE